MRQLSTKREGLQVYCADALALLASLPEASVNLIATDPPYFRVKDEPWDRQWDKAEGFLSWLGQVCDEFRRVLKPNGSLYLFASPQMASRVEAVVGERFNVLNHIVWAKPESCKAATYGEERFRGFVEMSERCIFAEQHGLDGGPQIGDVIRRQRETASLSCDAVERALGYLDNAGRGSRLCYRWETGDSLPSPFDFARAMRVCGSGLTSDELWNWYHSLLRPFRAREDTPYTDVWDFASVHPYPGKHPCEKPLSLASHIVSVSSCPDDTLLDPFCGSGVFGEAALRLGRRAILGDASEHWSQYAAAKLGRQFGALPLGSGRVKKAKQPQQPSLLEVLA
jgi:adenine-specific DNA-methyltransferase